MAKVKKVKEVQVAWAPTPDMGSVQEPSKESDLCAGCVHEKSLHYGENDNCNKLGCPCGGFKK